MKKNTSKKSSPSTGIRAGFSPRPVKSLQLTTEDSPSGGSETPTPPEGKVRTLAAKKKTAKAVQKKGGVVRFKKKK